MDYFPFLLTLFSYVARSSGLSYVDCSFKTDACGYEVTPSTDDATFLWTQGTPGSLVNWGLGAKPSQPLVYTTMKGKKGSTTRLTSPMQPKGHPLCKLTFIHIVPKSYASLNIYLKQANQADLLLWTSDPEASNFGSMKTTSLTLPSSVGQKPSQFIFEAQTKSKTTFATGIDDIKGIECPKIQKFWTVGASEYKCQKDKKCGESQLYAYT